METALVMYYMDRLSLDEVNVDGMTPLSVARAFRNKHIVVGVPHFYLPVVEVAWAPTLQA